MPQLAVRIIHHACHVVISLSGWPDRFMYVAVTKPAIEKMGGAMKNIKNSKFELLNILIEYSAAPQPMRKPK